MPGVLLQLDRHRGTDSTLDLKEPTKAWWIHKGCKPALPSRNAAGVIENILCERREGPLESLGLVSPRFCSIHLFPWLIILCNLPL